MLAMSDGPSLPYSRDRYADVPAIRESENA